MHSYAKTGLSVFRFLKECNFQHFLFTLIVNSTLPRPAQKASGFSRGSHLWVGLVSQGQVEGDKSQTKEDQGVRNLVKLWNSESGWRIWCLGTVLNLAPKVSWGTRGSISQESSHMCVSLRRRLHFCFKPQDISAAFSDFKTGCCWMPRGEMAFLCESTHQALA